MNSSNGSTATAVRPATVSVGFGTQIGVYPMFHGHHAAWADGQFQVDICNNVDDLLVGNRVSGVTHRFPITRDLVARIRRLFEAMDSYDLASGCPWAEHNITVRTLLVDAAARRLNGNPPQLNIFEPGMVGPAVNSDNGTLAEVYQMISGLFTEFEHALAA